MKYRVLKKGYVRPKPLRERNAAPSRSPENPLSSNHTALEFEAAAALLMLRYQYNFPSAVKEETTEIENIKVENTEVENTEVENTEVETTKVEATKLEATKVEATKVEANVDAPITKSSSSPTPPPPCLTDNCTPKDQPVRMAASSQPLKKRSIPPHLLRRSPTPAKQGSQNKTPNQIAIVKAKVKAKTPLPSARSDTNVDNKSLLNSCRNMLREFLDNQEKI